MAILIIDGQELLIADDIASDDKKLRQALTPSYPFMPNASICRKKTQDDKLCVEIVNSEAGTQQATPIAVLEKPQQSTPTQQADSTFPKNLQQEAEDNSVNEPTPFSPAWYPLQSRAIGIVQGQYFPSASDLVQGILVLDDGTIAPTKFMGSSLRFLKKKLDLLESPQFWLVYPSYSPEPPHLHLTVRGAKLPEREVNFEVIRSVKDYFSVRGLITYIDRQAGQSVVRIFRSVRRTEAVTPEEALKQSYFLLKLDGVLPQEASGHFADLKVKREGQKLVLEDFQFVQRLLELNKKKSTKKRSRRSGKSKKNSQTSGDSQSEATGKD